MEIAGQHESEWAAMAEVARLLGVGTAEAVRKWARQAEVDVGRPARHHERGVGGAGAAAAEERGVEAGQRNPQSSIDFLCGRARPATPLIVEFIRTHQGRRDGGGLVWGVEPICRVLTDHGLPIAPSTYYEHRDKTPTVPKVRDEQLKTMIAQVHSANYGVYGARKVWLQLNRQRAVDAEPISRCTVERLMGELGLAGAVRGKVKRTTIADPAAPRPDDLVQRRFAPITPNRLWVADITYVTTLSGWSTSPSSSTPTPARSWAGEPAPR